MVITIQDGREIDKQQNGIGISSEGVAYTLDSVGAQAIAFDWQAGSGRNAQGKDRQYIVRKGDYTGSIQANKRDAVQFASRGVRRLLPVECERLQAFPDGWTDVPYRGKPAADGLRYRALGNSMATVVIRWIGQRIDMLEAQRNQH